jgi:hypothetical protein
MTNQQNLPPTGRSTSDIQTGRTGSSGWTQHVRFLARMIRSPETGIGRTGSSQPVFAKSLIRQVDPVAVLEEARTALTKLLSSQVVPFIPTKEQVRIPEGILI